MLSVATIIVLSYLVGSIPGSLSVSKLFYGIELREHGSGNAGATNTFRVLGWKAGVAATIIDVGKGFLAAGLIATIRFDVIPPGLGFWQVDTVIRLIAGLAAVTGHMYPVWAGFRGGKGANTSAGVLFALSPVSMSIALVIFALVLFTSRYASLASLAATASFPASIAIRKYALGIETLDASLLFLSLLMAAAIFYAHRANIVRLRTGTESRINSFKPANGMQGKGEL
ncbi:MAG: glycerol-3-phosphate acyltransferase PlsY [Rhodothermales bacterium]|jgi:glycerol-3-phosphate acyltransferase PlsY